METLVNSNLKEKEQPFCIGKINDPKVERIVVGHPIPELLRKTFPVYPDEFYRRKDNLTGSIGFLDFLVKEDFLPIEFDKIGTIGIIYTIGIEPEYQRIGYGTSLIKEFEAQTKKRNVNIVGARGIVSDIGQRLLIKNNYYSITKYKGWYICNIPYIKDLSENKIFS